MSYCVNCGVELSPSERRCPLCGTEVINPREPWQEPAVRPYPHQAERMLRRVDRQFAAALVAVVLAIPILVTMLCDLLPDGRLSWSFYVFGALTMLMVWVLPPLAASRYHRLRFLSLDGAAACLYLWGIAHFSGGNWFLPLGLPLAAGSTGALLLLVYLFRQRWGRDPLNRTALLLLLSGLLAMGVELAVDLYLGSVQFQWAPYVLISCWVLAAAARLVARRQKIREEIAKRLFY